MLLADWLKVISDLREGTNTPFPAHAQKKKQSGYIRETTVNTISNLNASRNRLK